MKKQIAIITILALALTGCSGGNAAASQTIGTQPQKTDAPPGTDTAQAAGSNRPGDQTGVPQGKRVRGQIQDILGNEVTLALTEEPKRPEGATGTTQAARPTGGDMMGGPPEGGRQTRTVKLTGETQVIQIPVGVPIVSRGQSGETSLQLSDLTTGDIITIQYDADGVTIIQVNVAAGSTQ